MVYSSIKNDKIKDIKKLSNKKYREKTGMFIVEGMHLIEEAYNCDCLLSVVVLDGIDIDMDVDKIYVTDNVMRYLSDLDTPFKCLGICRKKNDKKINGRVLILDNIQDPGNLGTIIRSSVAFNFNTLLVSNNSVDVYNQKVIRASQGMLFKLNIIVCDIKKEIELLKKNNYHIVGTDVVNGSKINEFAKDEKLAIIMGNEGNGLSTNIKGLCDDYIYIDMNSACESLNVGVAASIILYELNKE